MGEEILEEVTPSRVRLASEARLDGPPRRRGVDGSHARTVVRGSNRVDAAR